jgi:GLPGLI family protein
MQKITLLVIAIILSCGYSANAEPKDFSGIVIYNISYDNADVDPQMMAMMPKTLKMMIKGGKTRTEMSMGGMGTNVNIFDSETNSGVMLMDMMGQKFAMELSADDIEEELEEGPDVKVDVTSETKEIAGYICKKAIVKVLKDNGSVEAEMEVYFTDELGSGAINSNEPMFKDIDGVMLEYSIKEENITMKMTAVSVDKKKLSDSEFEIPEGYKKVTEEELQNMFGGGL